MFCRFCCNCGFADSYTLHEDHENSHEIVHLSGIPHVRQERSWDCGLACLQMVLRYALSTPLSKADFNKLVASQSFKKSVWTIDLCFMLYGLGVGFEFYTSRLGADPSYASDAYYQKTFAVDQQRVNSLFAESKKKGMKIQEKQLPLSDILRYLKRDRPAIVLVNANRLYCLHCAQSFVQRIRKSLCRKAYCGHYVVVVGYDLLKREIFYRDPASSKEMCIATFSMFDDARRSVGTDDDIVFVMGKQRLLVQPSNVQPNITTILKENSVAANGHLAEPKVTVVVNAPAPPAENARRTVVEGDARQVAKPEPLKLDSFRVVETAGL